MLGVPPNLALSCEVGNWMLMRLTSFQTASAYSLSPRRPRASLATFQSTSLSRLSNRRTDMSVSPWSCSMAANWHDDPSRPARRQLHRSGLTSVPSSMSTATIAGFPVLVFRVKRTSIGLGGRRWTVPVVDPPMLTVAVRASLPLELLFDGVVVADMLLDRLNVLSGRVVPVDTDGAIGCCDTGKRLEGRGHAGNVDVALGCW